MLLVLALVAMGDRGDVVNAGRAVAEPSASGTARPSPSAKPSPSHTSPRAVERRPVTVKIAAAPGDTRSIKKQLRAVTAKYGDRQAAFVLTFGGNPDPGAGKAYAHGVNRLLAAARPSMFRGSTTRDFIQLTGRPDHAELEIYFYTR